MNQRLPVFFEALDGEARPALQIVREVRKKLFARGFSPLPFASNLRDFREILGAIRTTGKAPGLFVINTHGAERLLSLFDEVMGETPVVFFRRELLWLRERESESGAPGVTAAIGALRARLTVIRNYGLKNSAQVATTMALKIERFIRVGNFRSLETSIRLENLDPKQIQAP